jgi:hypothetical protein
VFSRSDIPREDLRDAGASGSGAPALSG